MEIRIEDVGAESPRVLLALAAMLSTLAGQTAAAAPAPTFADQVKSFAADVGAKLHPADNPAQGMPTAKEAFGSGNVVADSGTASSPNSAATSADSAPPAVEIDPRVAFAAPNVAPPTTSGPPPLPPVTPPTSQLGNAEQPADWPFKVPGAAAPAPASAPAGSTSTVQLDAEGLPHDNRIHSTPAKINADGKWKARRGLQEIEGNRVKAELRAALSVPNGAPPPPPPMTPPPIPGMPTPGAAAPAAGNAPLTVGQLLPRITAAIGAGMLTPEGAGQMLHALSDGKVTNVAMLAVAPHLIPLFVAQLDALGIPQ